MHQRLASVTPVKLVQPFALVLATIAGILSLQSVHASTFPVSTLRNLIYSSIAAHEPTVVIPSGIYKGGPADDGKVVLLIENAENLKIIAKDVELVSTMRTRAILFHNCKNVELDGLTIDYDPLTFTQGKVTAAAGDNSWIDVTIDNGYPVAAYSRIDVIDPKTRYTIHGQPFLWGTTASIVEPNVVRVSLKRIGDAAPIGSLVTLSDGCEPSGIPHGITLEQCRGGMALKNVTVYCAPGMGIVDYDSVGGTKMTGVRIVPGPPPLQNTEPRLLTTSWDGIMCSELGIGPDTENCTIEDCGDDSWSVQSTPFLVIQSDSSHIVLAGGVQLSPGDTLRTSLNAPPITVTSSSTVPIEKANIDPAVLQKLADAQSWSLWAVDHRNVQLMVVTVAVYPSVGTSLYSPEHQGNGFIFRNNYVHSQGRLLIKAGGIVSANKLIDTHNIVVDPETADGGASGIENVEISGNDIVGAENFCQAPWSTQAGAVSIAYGAAGAFSNITIKDNRFENVDAVNIWCAGVRGLSISGNKFINPQHNPLSTSGSSHNINQAALICLRNCADVQLKNNKLASPGKYEKTIIDSDSSVTFDPTADKAIPFTK